MDSGHLPSKRSRPDSAKTLSNGQQSQQPPQQQQLSVNQIDKSMIGKWLRADLEDKYLSLYQDHAKLKEKFRLQDDKIGDFKLVLKRKRDEIRQLKVQGGASAAELRATDQVVKLELRNAELEKQNEQLQQRLALMQQQQQGQGRTATRGANIRILQPHHHQSRQQQQQPTMGQDRQRSLGRTEDARNERTRLMMAQGKLETEFEAAKDRWGDRETELTKRIQDLESDLDLARLQSGAEKRSALGEDLDKVRLQRELRERLSFIEQLQGRCEAQEERMRETVETNARFVEELERMKRELRQRDRELELAKESAGAAQSTRRRLMELEQALEDANKEAKILREANEKLTNSAFDTERERQWKAREMALMTQIRQLEATMHRDVGEKGEFLDKLEEERNKAETVEKELGVLRIRFFELQQKHESLRDKLKFFNKEGAVDFDELDEALVLVKQRRQQREPSQLDFLQRVDAEVARGDHRRLREIEAAHADTIQELEKTRQLLEAQYRINQDLKASQGITERQLDSVKADCDTRMAESAKLLDIRAARIRKLERQLRDVAYGTKQFALIDQQLQESQGEEADGLDEVNELVHLQNGENLVEFHVGRVTLTEAGVRAMSGDSEPALFCTWAFYACELQTSEVTRGLSPDFDKTVQYVVKVDDAFLHYVNREKVRLELFKAVGVSYQSLAACGVSFRELMDARPTTRVSGRAALVSDGDGGVAETLGWLEYWFRMRVPMDQAMRLYRERAKALGYMSANHQAAAEGLKALDDLAEGRRPAGGANRLSVKVTRCRGLRARRPDWQPNPYVCYNLCGLGDTVSPAVPNSSDPEFHFHQLVELPQTEAVDKYLRTQRLTVWVLDEADPEDSAFLGVAHVDLVSLSRNKSIAGAYELLAPDGAANGSIELEMAWQFAYASPVGPASDGPAAALMTGEAELLLAAAAPPTKPPPSPLPPPPTKQSMEAPKPPSRSAVVAELRSEGSNVAQSSSVPSSPVVRSSTSTPIPTATPAPPTPQRRPPASTPSTAAALAAAAAEKRLHLAGAGETQASQTQVSSLLDASVDTVTSITDTREAKDALIVRTPTPAQPQPPPRQEPSPAESADDSDADDYGDDYEEDEPQEEDGEEAGNSSDGVVTAESRPRPQPRHLLTATGRPALDACVVEILSVQFAPSSRALSNPQLDNTSCYVSFQLPGYPSEETETPNSLPTPRPGRTRPEGFHLAFNFTNKFDYGFESNYEKRQRLALMLLERKLELPVSVVCETTDPDSEFFKDVGRAAVPLEEFVRRREDISKASFPLLSDKEQVGSIVISTDLPSLLLDVYSELPDAKKSTVTFID